MAQLTNSVNSSMRSILHRISNVKECSGLMLRLIVDIAQFLPHGALPLVPASTAKSRRSRLGGVCLPHGMTHRNLLVLVVSFVLLRAITGREQEIRSGSARASRGEVSDSCSSPGLNTIAPLSSLSPVRCSRCDWLLLTSLGSYSTVEPP